MKLTYSEILEATESFRADYLLGSGGSGHVYKGFIRGQVCAFKVLKPSSEDKSREKEFHAELSILGRMSHPNLIRLVGYCQDRSHRALVYEYLRNGSLDDQLHGLNRVHLSWHQRLTILLGATRAIDYLHMGGGGKFSPVIHRDLKTSNILIDDQLRAKVSDLGFAKLIPRDKSLATTTGVLGTIGYLAPEYFHTGQLSRKSDMYCLGVVILEAMTGRRPVEVIQMPRSQMHLVYWARLQLRDRKKVVALLDAMFADGAYCEKSVCKVAAVTAKCLAEEPDLRPTAAEVLAELEAAHQLSSQFQSKLVWGGKK
ncbi:hypothetical protein CBR_g19657 [Chara braunii]|uniref:Protein kinase domain-containing protein n=1 Tax=Chara braunii TaxID=69332 RepID=A0A388KYK7_CHABU|nr:hypothetical protein CBR_g19657 [Chara braunii]|eukprot:GBG75144.1 hypothetical protein CBR_g19657 [Chara braunii]